MTIFMATEEYETRISKRQNKKLRKYEMIWPWSISKVKGNVIEY